ncbi:MAG: esterase family protein [Alistipes sp.]|jgi:enterochelin esterase-like enzyme|nr:esterase family protein [Alistipes sp.]
MKKILLLLAAASVAMSAMGATGAMALSGSRVEESDRPGQPSPSRIEEFAVESELLGVVKHCLVYLPAGYDARPDKNYPVLYLLHGAGDDHTGWRDKGNVRQICDERIAAGLATAMIVVMPDASGQTAPDSPSHEGGTTKNRGYFDLPDWPYERHFFEELIPAVEERYRTVGDKRHRAVSGLSMGGGGTVGYAMHRPEMFSSAAPMSGALGGMSRATMTTDRNGDNFVAVVLLADARRIEALKSVRWWVDCGDDDFLWEANVDFLRAMRSRGVPLQFRMRDGGHTWSYWQSSLADVLTFVSAGFAE